jgi:hypothetical protein
MTVCSLNEFGRGLAVTLLFKVWSGPQLTISFMIYSAARGCSRGSLPNPVRYSSFVLVATRVPNDLVAASLKFFLYVCF